MKSEKKHRLNTYHKYTLLFVVMYTICCGLFFVAYGRGYFRWADGFDQHYQSFSYIGRSIRQFFVKLFTEHKLVFKMWDMSIGYGSDVPTSLSAYLWDPFNWISVFFPSSVAEYGYALMIILKIYVSGLAFVVLTKYRKHPDYAILAAAMTYIFSYTLFVGFYQSFFINPMYTFPLIILGVDMIYENKKPYLYIFTLAFVLLNYFYFAYMMAIMVVCYCILKLCFSNQIEKTVKAIVQLVLRFIGYSIASAGLAAIALLPVLLQLSKAGRLSLSHYVPVLYDKGYYSGMLAGMITGYDLMGRDCKIGYGVIALICVFILFLRKGRHTQQKIEFVIMLVALAIPYIGHVMNGFSYPASRWVFAFALLMAYIVALILPEIADVTQNQAVGCFCLTIVYVIACRLLYGGNSEKFEIASIGMISLCVLLMVIKKIDSNKIRAGIVITSCISSMIISHFCLSAYYDNMIGSYIYSGQAYDISTNYGGLPLLNYVKNSDSERYDRNGLLYVRNASWLYGTGGMDFYISIYNDNIDKFHNEMSLRTDPYSYCYEGLNERSELEALMGVNHYFVNEGSGERPYGYNTLEYTTETHDADYNYYNISSYTSDRNNSLFYLFDKAISSDEYEKLDVMEKQQALLQSIVIDDGADSSVKDLNINNDNVDYTVSGCSGLSYDTESGIITVNNSGAVMYLSYNDLSNSELYLYLDNINFEHEDDSTYSISCQAYNGQDALGGVSSSYSGNNDKHHMYGGKHNWLLNLGYTDGVSNTIVITFNNVGEYSLDGIKIYSRSASEIDENLDKLDNSGIVFDIQDNTMSGNVTVKKEQYLFTSVPYSSGWKCYVDGKETEISLTDTAFMSIKLSKGKHNVVFKYCTPGLKAGAVISVVVLVGFVTMICYRKRRDKND